jgi:5,10-methylenetetrahydromethanopterin reductase
MGSTWTDSLGVALMGADVPRHAAEWARAAEGAELGSLWLIEDYFHPGAFALAGVAAAVTERVTIGLGVVNPYTRHPALLAMETAALAGAAPGRLVLGLGSSNRRWIEEQMGIPFKTPLADLREAVSILRRLLGGEPVSVSGNRFHLDRVQLDSPPAREVPIVLGVKGPRALGLAGEVADGVLCSLLSSPAHVRRARATAAAGDRAFAVAAYITVLVDEDGRRAREGVRPLLAHYLGALHGQSILADAGLGPDRTQPFRDALLNGESAARLVTDEMIETLAVAGTPGDCRRQLERWAAAGLDAPVAVVPKRADLVEQISLIGRELAPAWKERRWR